MHSNYFPLPEDYRRIWANRKQFELCIVGKDPYPTNPIGIPFCKPSWPEMDYRTSGTYVLRSLGIEPGSEHFADPREAFLQLALEGVGFLNSTYWFIGRPFAKRYHQQMVAEDTLVNLPFLAKSRRILLCGEAAKVPWLLQGTPIIAEYQDELGSIWERCESIPHPDIRNRTNPRRRLAWQAVWGDGVLAAHRCPTA